MLNNALAYAQSHQEQSLADLISLLKIPSISTLPENKTDMQCAAQWLVDKLTDVGLQNARVSQTPGHPVVYADWLKVGPSVPTVLIYGHYDVQPADPLDEWSTPPFEPTVKGDKIFGRGTADDKGQLYVHIAAVDAYLKTAGSLPVNVKFILEGEEELGSVHLEQFVEENKELLKADVALISDTSMLDPQTPALVTGVRGLTYMEVELRGSRQDLHSGMYGGVVENPLNALVRMLASLHNEQGQVTIPGFYDDVQELTPQERDAINNGRVTEAAIKAETGVPALWGESGYTPAERIGVRPTLDIHGIKGGFIGEGQKTVIAAKAMAKVSMRLVPHQNSGQIASLFTQHIQAITPPTMEVTVRKLAGSPGAVVDMNDPAIDAAATAYQQVFGKKPVYLREGGSLPVVAMFMDVLNAPVVMMGFGLPEDNLHSPNESFHLPNFYRGIETAIHYYNILAK